MRRKLRHDDCYLVFWQRFVKSVCCVCCLKNCVTLTNHPNIPVNQKNVSIV